MGCDNLVYLPLEELIKSCMRSRTDPSVQGFEVGVFSGRYVTDGLEQERIAVREIGRNDRDVGLPKAGHVPCHVQQLDAHKAISLRT